MEEANIYSNMYFCKLQHLNESHIQEWRLKIQFVVLDPFIKNQIEFIYTTLFPMQVNHQKYLYMDTVVYYNLYRYERILSNLLWNYKESTEIKINSLLAYLRF